VDFIYRTEFEGVKILLWQLAVMLIFFIDFHPGPPRTIWQGTRRPLHKWPLLESAPVYEKAMYEERFAKSPFMISGRNWPVFSWLLLLQWWAPCV